MVNGSVRGRWVAVRPPGWEYCLSDADSNGHYLADSAPKPFEKVTPDWPGNLASWVAFGAVLGALSVRMLSDLLGSVPQPVPGWGLSTWIAGLILLLLTVSTVRVWRVPAGMKLPMGAFALVVLLGLVRAPDPLVGLRLSVKYLSPFVVLLAYVSVLTERRHQRWTLRFTMATGGAVALVSLWAGWAMPGAWTTMNATPRLLGLYADPHTHSLTMACVSVLGLFFAVHGETRAVRRTGVGVALVAAAALSLTSVRTGVVFWALAAMGALWPTGRVRAVGVGLGGFAILLVTNADLLARFGEASVLWSWNPPPGGWGELGTGRVSMWSKSFSAFVEEGPIAIAFGMGLGGHRTFWKGVDPHNEYLVLWYQLGPLGVLSYVWLLAATIGSGLRATANESQWARALGHLTAAFGIGVLVTNAMSNAFLARVTPAWLFWGIVAVTLAAARAPSADAST